MSPEELQNKIREAKEAGYTEEEINAVLGFTPTPSQRGVQPAVPQVPNLTPEERARMTIESQPRESSEANWVTGLGGLGAAVAPYVIPAAGAAAAAFGGSKLFNAWKESAAAAKALAEAKVIDEEGRRFRHANPKGTSMPGTLTPAQPQSSILGPNGQPLRPVTPPAQPVAPPAQPVAPPAQPVAPSTLSRVLPNVVKGGIGAGLMLYPSSTGPRVPSVGRLKGSEINPMTGRAWTPNEIKVYEANAQQFDSQMLPKPQLPR